MSYSRVYCSLPFYGGKLGGNLININSMSTGQFSICFIEKNGELMEKLRFKHVTFISTYSSVIASDVNRIKEHVTSIYRNTATILLFSNKSCISGTGSALSDSDCLDGSFPCLRHSFNNLFAKLQVYIKVNKQKSTGYFFKTS